MVINYSENTCAMVEIVGLYLRDPSLFVASMGGGGGGGKGGGFVGGIIRFVRDREERISPN